MKAIYRVNLILRFMHEDEDFRPQNVQVSFAVRVSSCVRDIIVTGSGEEEEAQLNYQTIV